MTERLRGAPEKGRIPSMLTSRDLMQLEERYRSLRESLATLTDVLLHSRHQDDVLQAFQTSEQIAISMFRDEETAMAQCQCLAEKANKVGHQWFMEELGQCLHQYREMGSGIPVATMVRRDLMPWLYEHHRVVDHQMIHQLQKLGRPGETTAFLRMSA